MHVYSCVVSIWENIRWISLIILLKEYLGFLLLKLYYYITDKWPLSAPPEIRGYMKGKPVWNGLVCFHLSLWNAPFFSFLSLKKYLSYSLNRFCTSMIKERNSYRRHPFSIYAKCSQKLTYFTLWYAHVDVCIRG